MLTEREKNMTDREWFWLRTVPFHLRCWLCGTGTAVMLAMLIFG